MTLYEVIKDIVQHSESVFVYDFKSFNKNDDIHNQAKYVNKLWDLEQLEELNAFPLNQQIDFNELMLSKAVVTEYGEKTRYYGMVGKNNGQLLFYELYDLLKLYNIESFKEKYENVVEFNGLSYKECFYTLQISHCILSLFYVYKTFNLVFMHYLCKCFADKEFYYPKSLENMFLISFSEVPNFIEAIKQVRIKNLVNEKFLVLKKNNVRISDVFISFYSSEAIKKEISRFFSMSASDVELLIYDMISIFTCF